MDFPKREQKTLKYWRENKVFQRVLAHGRGKPRFVFYEGPPTANGKPGIHHVLVRAFKDVVCRYKTMRGFLVERKAGWDTHGLPVELEVEKELGFHSKSDIERYGVARFNARCKKSVWKYKTEWEKLTERIGFWLDMEHPYITYEAPYMETVWGILAEAWKKKLLYEDYRVVPHCPRCVSTLSSHEVAQGYKRVKENSIYVRFPIKSSSLFTHHSSQGVSLLVWTTTPWTLPANVAVAVHPEIRYALVEIKGERLVLAKDRVGVLAQPYRIIKEFTGADMLGWEYRPPYAFFELEKSSVWRVVAGSFVSIKEGTGLVHLAPAFGEDDMNAGKKEKLPVVVTVDENGAFNPTVAQPGGEAQRQEEIERYRAWIGQFVKDLDPSITANLATRNLLFKEELYEHDYPFCWRCSAPLLYYAKRSWFMKMSSLREKLLAENEKINWVPAYLQRGRFGEWLKEVKDWALSRERYWGIPLPVWKCDRCGAQEVVGSVRELRSKKFSSNRYILLRHGEALSNAEGFISSWPETKKNPLTQRGTREVQHAAKTLEKQKVDLIFSSDLTRCAQTAEIIGKKLGLSVVYDKRLREFNLGEFNGKDTAVYEKFVENSPARFAKRPKGGETWYEVRARMRGFIEECERRFAGKTIVCISHGDPLWLLKGAMDGRTDEALAEDYQRNGYHAELLGKTVAYPRKGIPEHLRYVKLPRDKNGTLDLHRPFVDEAVFGCGVCKGQMRRCREVIDVWFDSGAMPFAQFVEYIGQAQSAKRKAQRYPADFICEAIDQTRGWFYTLLALGVVLSKGTPYRNVISLGHVLDRHGKKMSKSIGNIVNPWEMIERYGADAVRWYLFTINAPGEPKRFDEQEVRTSYNRFLVTFWNVYQFWRTYAPKTSANRKAPPAGLAGQSAKRELTILDRWILSCLHSVIGEVRNKMDAYDIVGAARAIESFVVDDLSNWYVRRSRPRFQHPRTKQDLAVAAGVLGEALLVVSELLAPFAPFIGDEIWRSIAGGFSVHATPYPAANEKLGDPALEREMRTVRKLVELGFAARAKAKIKTRQPLGSMVVSSGEAPALGPELLSLVAEELNIGRVEVGATKRVDGRWVVLEREEVSVALDTMVSEELRDAGFVREVVRAIQDLRKEAGCKPQDWVTIYLSTGEAHAKQIIERYAGRITEDTHAKDVFLRLPPAEHTVRAKRQLVIPDGELEIAVQ